MRAKVEGQLTRTLSEQVCLSVVELRYVVCCSCSFVALFPLLVLANVEFACFSCILLSSFSLHLCLACNSILVSLTVLSSFLPPPHRPSGDALRLRSDGCSLSVHKNTPADVETCTNSKQSSRPPFLPLQQLPRQVPRE